MDPTRLVIATLIIVAITIGAIFAVPFLAVRFTQPKWALGKSVILFVALALLLSILLPAFLSVPGAFTIALFRHRARVARYALRQQQESEIARSPHAETISEPSNEVAGGQA